MWMWIVRELSPINQTEYQHSTLVLESVIYIKVQINIVIYNHIVIKIMILAYC